MRRRLFAVVLLLCLLLSGCSDASDAMQPALSFRTALLEAGGCAFSCDVSADYGNAVYEFSLDCEYSDSVGMLTVTKPDSVSGISAEITQDGAAILFDEVRLEYGKLANGTLAPLCVPWLLGSAWESDYISSTGLEDSLCRVTILKGYDDRELTVDTWLEDGVPVYAEVSHSGQRVLIVHLTEFHFSS